MSTSNVSRYPGNIFQPEKISTGRNTYTMYKADFRDLYSLYEYLKSDPEINASVFRRLHSETGSYDFAGMSYPNAVENLINIDDPGYVEFLDFQKDLKNDKRNIVSAYRNTRSVAGGHLNVPAYSAGAPLCYDTVRRYDDDRFIRIHVELSYYWGTSKKQVLHRAIIITNILKALENAGYKVAVDAFEMSSCGSELIYVNVNVKKVDGHMNMIALYKTLCPVEFLRRILFRVLETLDVKNDWEDGYGCTCDEEFVRKALHFNNNDIFFDQPREMGINGEDLAQDFENAIKHLNLQDKIDIEKAKREFREEARTLSKKRSDY